MILTLAGCVAQRSEAPSAPQEADTAIQVQTPPPVQINTQTQAQVETKEEILPTKTPEPAPIVKVEPAIQLPERVQELVTKAKTKIKSYKYLLKAPPENRFLHTYFIQGNKMKIKLFEGNAYILGKYYDTIYLDTTAKTATARCEDERRCAFGGEDYTRKVFEANYNDYVTKTPMDWLNEITNAEVIGPEVVDGMSTLKIKTTRAGQIIEMWLHTTYGVPIKISIVESEQPTEVYQFADSAFNSLREVDVNPLFTTSQY